MRAAIRKGVFPQRWNTRAGTDGLARFKEPQTQAVVFALDMSKQKRAEATALEAHDWTVAYRTKTAR